MRTSAVGMMAVSILVLVTCLGFGIAKAGGIDWHVEVLDSSSGYQQEGKPITFFHLNFPENKKLPQEAKYTSENMQPESPIETGSLPSKGNADSYNFDTSGNPHRRGVDTVP